MCMNASDSADTPTAGWDMSRRAPWPLTGRAQELALIVEAISGEGDRGGVVIAGGAGVGKTRLAAEVVDIARRNGWITHLVVGTSAAQSIPLGVFAQWIEGADGRLLNMVETVIADITAGSEGQRVLIVVDDAQFMDDLSAFVLHQLVRRGQAKVIMTMRTEQATAESIHPLWQEANLLRLELQPLSRLHCDTLLGTALGGEIGATTAQRMWEMTRGNVLFLYQLVRQELEAGRLRNHDERWRWSGEITASPTLVDLVELYVGTAPDQILDVLDVIAVAEWLDLALISALVDPAELELAERLGFIVVDTQGATAVVRFSHPLYAEVRRTRIGLLRAARLRGSVAAAIQSHSGGSGPVDSLRLALLWLDSDLPPDAEILHGGACQAFLRLDLALTNRLCGEALAVGAGPKTRLLYALSLYSMGCGAEAEELLDALPIRPDDQALWVTAALIKAANLQFTRGRPADSWKALEAALAAATPELAPQLMPLRVVQLAMAARPADAVRAAASLDSKALAPLPMTVLACGQAIANGDLGQPDQATAAVVSCTRSTANSPEAAYQMVALNLVHADALIIGGLIHEAQLLGEHLHAQWADVPWDPSGVAVAIKGMAALARGDLAVAQQQLRTAIVECESSHGRTGGMYLFWLTYAEALARAGHVDAAGEALEKVEHYRHPSYHYVESHRLLVMGWVAAAGGHASAAVDLAAQAADFACRNGQLAREVMALQTAIQFGRNDSADRLGELRGCVGGLRAPLIARWAHAADRDDGDELLVVSGELEKIGDRIAAADTAAHAAHAFGRLGLHRPQIAASARATRLMSICGGNTPAVSAVAEYFPLSEREREIATLIGRGLSNKQIADALFMSVRTVEGHIYRARTRIGLKSRTELAELLAQFAG